MRGQTEGRARGGPVAAAAGVAALVAGVLAGCLGYRVGSTLPPGIRTVYVPPFANESGEPQIERETTRATLQEIQKDGTLRVAPEDRADAVLRVRLTRYALEPLRYEADRAKTAREYRLRLSALVQLTARGADRTLVECWVSGETTFEAETDLTAARAEALPSAAEDLAHQIVKAITQFW